MMDRKSWNKAAAAELRKNGAQPAGAVWAAVTVHRAAGLTPAAAVAAVLTGVTAETAPAVPVKALPKPKKTAGIPAPLMVTTVVQTGSGAVTDYYTDNVSYGNLGYELRNADGVVLASVRDSGLPFKEAGPLLTLRRLKAGVMVTVPEVSCLGEECDRCSDSAVRNANFMSPWREFKFNKAGEVCDCYKCTLHRDAQPMAARISDVTRYRAAVVAELVAETLTDETLAAWSERGGEWAEAADMVTAEKFMKALGTVLPAARVTAGSN